MKSTNLITPSNQTNYSRGVGATKAAAPSQSEI